MAGNDLRQARRPGHVDISARERTFLEELIEMVQQGTREELAELGRGRERCGPLRRESAAYERILAGLRGNELEADADVRAVLAKLSEVVDAGNEYSRVVFEHLALCRLRALADGAPTPNTLHDHALAL